MTETFLGIDIGTTNIKFAVIENQVLQYRESKTLTTNQQVGSCYQLASDILAQIKAGILALPKEYREAIQIIGVSAPMHSLWPVDLEKQTDFEQVYLWSDSQATGEIEEFKSESPKLTENFYQRTGTPIHPMSPFAKILHLKNEFTNEKFSRLKWYGIKELVLKYFVGEYLLDKSTASATGLFNIHDLIWDQTILDYLGISQNVLARIVESTDLYSITSQTAKEIGVSPAVQIMVGASDGCLAAYGGFMSQNNRNSLTIGTSAATRRVTDKINLNSVTQNFCYYLGPKQYVVGAPSNNGGNVLAWLSQTLGVSLDNFFSDVSTILARTEIGANGVVFSPYLNGERAPFWDTKLHASFSNITIKTEKLDFIRAVIEGILQNVRRLVEMTDICGPLIASGGFFRARGLWQITADVLGRDLVIAPENEPIGGLYVLFSGKTMKQTTTREQAKVFYSRDAHASYDEQFHSLPNV